MTVLMTTGKYYLAYILIHFLFTLACLVAVTLFVICYFSLKLVVIMTIDKIKALKHYKSKNP